MSETQAKLDDAHPILSAPSHDELEEQMFVRDLKTFVGRQVEPLQKRLVEKVAVTARTHGANDPVSALREEMMRHESFRSWLSLRRESQTFLWDVVADSIDRQKDILSERAEIAAPLGALVLDESFAAPDYLTEVDIHLMPGGYAGDPQSGSVLQGALMDRGGAVYMLGRNGGSLNDLRGQAAMAHVLTCYPDIEPKRILELGSGVGVSTVPAKVCFPEAEVHGIDVGASLLRYAHVRAERMGVALHFSQQNAERTNFPDGLFDIVFSCVVLHETSPAAMTAIMNESRRLLRPGGVALHLEVPSAGVGESVWGDLHSDLETLYNNEPNWTTAVAADYAGLMRAAGFTDVHVGYQRATPDARTGPQHFGPENEGPFRSWFIASGRA
jgi:ubiquinone/menaquinone biosynthesis C-methylase UbiE